MNLWRSLFAKDTKCPKLTEPQDVPRANNSLSIA